MKLKIMIPQDNPVADDSISQDLISALQSTPDEEVYDIDAILADIHRQASKRKKTRRYVADIPKQVYEPSVALPPLKPATPPAPSKPAAPPAQSKSADPPGSVSLDQEVVLNMIDSVHELAQEVKQLRAEIKGSSYLADGAVQPEDKQNGNRRNPQMRGKIVDNSEIKKQKSNKAFSIISNILFYGVLVGLVLGAFLMKSNSGGRPFTFAGFSAFKVLTSSMEDVYPKGSLVITKSVDPNELMIGDDITYMVSATSSVTHRIIEIEESYMNTGARAFKTKGVMNQKEDKDPVAAVNVVGKVIFCSVFLGTAATFIGKNWPFLLFMIAVIVALISFLKWNMGRSADEEDTRKKKQYAKTGRHYNRTEIDPEENEE